jgi:peptidoglycan/xylan/chitin deacetylase (PgdA/CDA1 family)
MMLISRAIRKLSVKGVDLPPFIYSRIRVDSDDKTACLTFDDGPHTIYTMEIINILSKYKLKATFFFIGSNIEKNYKIAEQIFAEGHSIQNHSFSHIDFSSVSPKIAEIDIRRCRSVINGITGIQKEKMFRPPHGLISVRNIFVLRSCNEKVVLWTDEIDDQDMAEYGRHSRCLFMGHDDSIAMVKTLDLRLQVMIDCGYHFIDLETVVRK